MRKVFSFLLAHWYATMMTVVGVLIAVEVLGTWAGFAAPFLAGIGLLIKLARKK